VRNRKDEKRQETLKCTKERLFAPAALQRRCRGHCAVRHHSQPRTWVWHHYTTPANRPVRI